MNSRPVLGLNRPLVGVLHLDALPGAPRHHGNLRAVLDSALRDAGALAEAGFSALLLENYGDIPFRPSAVDPETVASMTAIAIAVREAHPDLPLGINVLRCDPLAALSIAHASDAAFIRVNVHAGAALTDQGILSGRADETLRLRERLRADVQIWADVRVKHAAPLAARPLEEEAADLVERSLADVLLITGSGTGHAADLNECARVRTAAAVPVLVASGVSSETLAETLRVADGVVVGSDVRESGRAGAPVDPGRARQFVESLD